MIFFSVNVTKMLDHLNPGRGTEKPVDPDDQVEAGCSECRQGILLRVLGKSGDAVYDYFEDIAREV